MCDFIDPPSMSECLVSSRENDCAHLDAIDSLTSLRQSSNINREEERRDSINDTEKRKSNKSLPITVLNVSVNEDCNLSKGKEKALCVAADVCRIDQRDYSPNIVVLNKKYLQKCT